MNRATLLRHQSFLTKEALLKGEKLLSLQETLRSSKEFDEWQRKSREKKRILEEEKKRSFRLRRFEENFENKYQREIGLPEKKLLERMEFEEKNLAIMEERNRKAMEESVRKKDLVDTMIVEKQQGKECRDNYLGNRNLQNAEIRRKTKVLNLFQKRVRDRERSLRNKFIFDSQREFEEKLKNRDKKKKFDPHFDPNHGYLSEMTFAEMKEKKRGVQMQRNLDWMYKRKGIILEHKSRRFDEEATLRRLEKFRESERKKRLNKKRLRKLREENFRGSVEKRTKEMTCSISTLREKMSKLRNGTLSPLEDFKRRNHIPGRRAHSFCVKPKNTLPSIKKARRKRSCSVAGVRVSEAGILMEVQRRGSVKRIAGNPGQGGKRKGSLAKIPKKGVLKLVDDDRDVLKKAELAAKKKRIRKKIAKEAGMRKREIGVVEKGKLSKKKKKKGVRRKEVVIPQLVFERIDGNGFLATAEKCI